MNRLRSRVRWGRRRSAAGISSVVALAAWAFAGCGGNEAAGGSPKADPQPPPPAAPKPAPASDAAAAAIERWYEVLNQGQKAGFSHVTWTASTWQGKPTVHDHTVQRTRTMRDMAGMTSEYATEEVYDVERAEDGTLWTHRAEVREGGRTTTSELTWTGTGYDLVTRLNGVEQKKQIATPNPVPLEAEPVLGRHVKAGEMKVGAKFDLPTLDWTARAVKSEVLEVVAREDGVAENGAVPTWKVVQRDPETQNEVTLWVDDDGALVALKAATQTIRRTTRAAAESMPARAATFSITTTMAVPVERIFSADRAWVDVHLTHDTDRPLPVFPTSPWSKALSTEGDPEKGWTIHTELSAYDVTGVSATIPVTDPKFAKDLESSVLLCVDHPKVVAAAKAAVGDEHDARKAAVKIAAFVFGLDKESSRLGEMTAVEILDEHSGDCSEHATLFVALCRAVGIPARRCSGWVCVGELWGAHAWAEIWVGAWIGVDPTTNDVGTAARYLFFGRDDDPTTHSGIVTSRIRDRISLAVTALEEGDEHVDLTDVASLRTIDLDARTARQRLLGLRLEGIPKDWRVTWQDFDKAKITGPGLLARIHVAADQGYRDLGRFSAGDEAEATTFGGAPAVVFRQDTQRAALVNSRRRNVRVQATLTGDDPDATWALLEKVLAPSFVARPAK